MADTNNGPKTAREAERDVEAARANLARSINDLEARLSPNAFVEQGIAYFRGDGRRHLNTLARNAQANPIPLILIGIGVAWLGFGSSRRPASQSGSARVSSDFYDDPVVYKNETEANEYERAEYRSSKDAKSPPSISSFGENAAAPRTMAERSRTEGFRTGAPSVATTRDPFGPLDQLEETDPAIPDDPFVKDNAIEEPPLGSKSATTTSVEADEDNPSFRDPIATSHSYLDDEKKV